MDLLAVHVLTSSARVAIQWLYTKRASSNEWTFNEVREKQRPFKSVCLLRNKLEDCVQWGHLSKDRGFSIFAL